MQSTLSPNSSPFVPGSVAPAASSGSAEPSASSSRRRRHRSNPKPSSSNPPRQESAPAPAPAPALAPASESPQQGHIAVDTSVSGTRSKPRAFPRPGDAPSSTPSKQSRRSRPSNPSRAEPPSSSQGISASQPASSASASASASAPSTPVSEGSRKPQSRGKGKGRPAAPGTPQRDHQHHHHPHHHPHPHQHQHQPQPQVAAARSSMLASRSTFHGPDAVSSTSDPETLANASARSSGPRRKIHHNLGDIVDEDDQLGSLARGLTNGDYECMICYENVRPRDAVWSCSTCSHVFHLKCIGKWSRSSASNEAAQQPAPSSSSSASNPGWRCPGCQSVVAEVPSEYRCFCGKIEDPPFNRFITPHSCGQTCSRERGCPHKCTLPCHPGPCKPCELMAPPVSCYCGRSSFVVRCTEILNMTFEKSCGEVCGKELNCGLHTCEWKCHQGQCPPCTVNIDHPCLCGRSTKQLKCGTPCVSWSCDTKCDHEYPCGIHTCPRPCHGGGHSSVCPLDPSVLFRCPCGSETVEAICKRTGVVRTSCADPVVTCDNTCGKVLPCGHRCRFRCHAGECEPCGQSVSLPCRCGRTEFVIECNTLKKLPNGDIELPVCSRVCTAKKHCKRHQCGSRCCPLEHHICEEVCGKTLKCGLHQCTFTCGHNGRCHDCFEGVSFDELSCHCGRTVVFPPIPCNTPPPKCSHPCIRPLPCGHPTMSRHNCHPDTETCPPCVLFVERDCACGKKKMNNVRCSSKVVPSCGQVCGKVISPCGHTCRRFCHSGACVDGEAFKCLDKCGKIRPSCGHRCGFNCHGSKECLEDRPCLFKIAQSCKCGNRISQVVCGGSKHTLGQAPQTLLCDDSCALLERNRRLAAALEITPTSRITIEGHDTGTEFTETLLKFAKGNMTWVKGIESQLEAFVRDESKRMLHFPHGKRTAMNFLYELASFYSLSPEIVDAERGVGSVIVRKQANRMPAVPAPLLSTAAVSYRPGTVGAQAAAASTNALKPLEVVNTRQVSMNALYLEGLQFGMDSRDVKILLEPIFGSDIVLSIKWISDDDCVLMLGSQTTRLTSEAVEEILIDRLVAVKQKFVENNWVRDVKCCWVTLEGEIRLGGLHGDEALNDPRTAQHTGSSELPGVALYKQMQGRHKKTVSDNPFNLLEMEQSLDLAAPAMAAVDPFADLDPQQAGVSSGAEAQASSRQGSSESETESGAMSDGGASSKKARSFTDADLDSHNDGRDDDDERVDDEFSDEEWNTLVV
ncbi:uncharacterized protein BJ171DRAFT_442072 [Polychytrium aggregatum]|uniref:uncharacterized protein n=1 Tax=Polychytrium aggregatum TaxID=110093 RepID=UPI0022FDDA75|nr:uncharacterized protein BJ171DRAFT_442072 [Polychytrium aggregatum]KAI9204843.1 hypothetical protein BJ171DRAFT_442072 [Polychytrium aggregatum]